MLTSISNSLSKTVHTSSTKVQNSRYARIEMVVHFGGVLNMLVSEMMVFLRLFKAMKKSRKKSGRLVGAISTYVHLDPSSGCQVMTEKNNSFTTQKASSINMWADGTLQTKSKCQEELSTICPDSICQYLILWLNSAIRKLNSRCVFWFLGHNSEPSGAIPTKIEGCFLSASFFPKPPGPPQTSENQIPRLACLEYPTNHYDYAHMSIVVAFFCRQLLCVWVITRNYELESGR